MAVIDKPVEQLQIWQGTEEQIKARIDSGDITDTSLAIATDVEYVCPEDIGDGVLTIQKNGVTIATFRANSHDNVTAAFSVTEPVQPDWDQTDSDCLDYIKHKPTVAQITVKRFE